MAKMMTSFAFSCLCHHRGVSGDTQFPGSRSSHGTPGLSPKGRLTHRSTPIDPGDLAGKYGVLAPAKDFEATLLGPNPTPGNSTLGTLSQDRSPRSESICPVEHRVLVRRDSGPIVPPPPGDSDQVMLSKNRSPRSESICLVERSSSCDTGSNSRLAMKGSVQQSSVNRPEDSEHVLVIPGPGSGLMTGTGYSGLGSTDHSW